MQETFNIFFEYKDGKLYRKIGTALCHRNKIGHEVGWVSGKNYKRVMVHNVTYRIHRVIWEMHNGAIPKGIQIDHINRNKLDNRIENLRLADQSLQSRNHPMHRNNTSGFKGVTFRNDSKKYKAFIRARGIVMTLGCFEHIEDACKARKNAELLLNYNC